MNANNSCLITFPPPVFAESRTIPDLDILFYLFFTSSPPPVPFNPPEVRRLMELGAADLTVANYPRAAESYRAAASQPTGHCPEVWDNVALACLLARDPGGCVVAAATCTALHPARLVWQCGVTRAGGGGQARKPSIPEGRN